MSILFIQAWDMVSGREEEYSKFVSQVFIPRCNRIGLRSVGGYYVEVGGGPRIISVKSVEHLEELYRAISTQDFKELVTELKTHVTGYRSKILTPTGRTRNAVYEIQKGVWKYNQYYDVLPGQKPAYAEFITGEYVPAVEAIDYVELTGGWNVLVGGPNEIIGELTFKDPVDIGRLLNNPSFRTLTQRLRKEFVTNYSARILRTTERFDEPRWFHI